MQMNAQRHLFFVENGTIFVLCWEDTLEYLTKFELVFWLQSKNYVPDALDGRELNLVTMTKNLTRNLT